MFLLFVFIALVFILLDISIFFLFIRKYRDFEYKASIIFVFLKLLVSLVYIFVSLNLFFGGFGPGAIMFLSTIPTGIILVVYFLFQVKLTFKRLLKEKLIFWLGGITIIIFHISPIVSHMPIKNTCFDLDNKKIATLRQSIQSFNEIEGYYPDSVNQLVPDYMSDMPRPTCRFLSFVFGDDFVYKNCDGESPVLITRTVDGVGFAVYSLLSDEYYHLGSFFDHPDPYSCR